MPVSCHFQGCKALLRIVKRRYIKYHAFAFVFDRPLAPQLMPQNSFKNSRIWILMQISSKREWSVAS